MPDWLDLAVPLRHAAWMKWYVKLDARLKSVERFTRLLTMFAALVLAAILIFGAPVTTLNAIVGAAFLISMPSVLRCFLAPIVLWHDFRGLPRDIPDEWR